MSTYQLNCKEYLGSDPDPDGSLIYNNESKKPVSHGKGTAPLGWLHAIALSFKNYRYSTCSSRTSSCYQAVQFLDGTVHTVYDKLCVNRTVFLIQFLWILFHVIRISYGPEDLIPQLLTYLGM
jgi:hypothetical protein